MAHTRVWRIITALALVLLVCELPAHALADEELGSSGVASELHAPAAADDSSAANQSVSLAAHGESELQQRAAAFDAAADATPANSLAQESRAEPPSEALARPTESQSSLSVSAEKATEKLGGGHESDSKTALVGVESAVLLVVGAAVLVVLVVAFKRQTAPATSKKFKTGMQDPLMQSLLYSDLDYAAM